MKKIVISGILLLLCTVGFSQNAKYIGVELCGASTGIGLRYDARIKGNNGIGYSAAVAYAHGIEAAYSKGSDLDNILIPAEINYLTGEHNSHFECAIGMMNGWYRDPSYKEYMYYFYINLGWRYQKPRGFMFRVGLSPSFGSGYHYYLAEKSWFYPYFGFGWSF